MNSIKRRSGRLRCWCRCLSLPGSSELIRAMWVVGMDWWIPCTLAGRCPALPRARPGPKRWLIFVRFFACRLLASLSSSLAQTDIRTCRQQKQYKKPGCRWRRPTIPPMSEGQRLTSGSWEKAIRLPWGDLPCMPRRRCSGTTLRSSHARSSRQALNRINYSPFSWVDGWGGCDLVPQGSRRATLFPCSDSFPVIRTV